MSSMTRSFVGGAGSIFGPVWDSARAILPGAAQGRRGGRASTGNLLHQTLCRSSSRASDFSLADPDGSQRIILVLAPGRMIEMEDEVAVVGGDRLVESDLSDTAPVLE